jgi:hypothetical protein
MFALHGLSGSLRCSPNSAAAQLASLKQCSPFIRIRLCFSAMQKAGDKYEVMKIRISLYISMND